MAQFSRYYTYIQPAVKSPKSQAYTMFILSFFAIAFFGIFAIRPTILTIISLQREIAQAKDLDSRLAQKLESLTKAQEVLDRLASKRVLIQEAIPSNPNVAQLMRFLEKNAADSHVAIGSVQVRSLALVGEEARTTAPGPQTLAAQTSVADLPTDDTTKPTGRTAQASASASQLQEAKFTFTVSGDIPAIETYMHNLTLIRRIVVVDAARIFKNEKDTTFTGDIAARAFITPQGGQ